MTGEMIFVFGVLGAAVVLFASDRVRLDIVALLVLIALMLGGVITVPEALAGFSDSAVLMIAGLFVVGEALVTTGIAFAIGDWLMRVGGAREGRLIALLMLSVATIGGFMSSTGIVAIFIPIALSIAGKTGLARRRLMMPLCYAALISGMMTLIATAPNLVVNAELRARGLEPFGFFDFTPIGFAVLAVGIAYVLVLGRRLLGTGDAEAEGRGEGQTMAEIAAAYGIGEKAHRLRVGPASPLVGNSLGALKLRTRFGVSILSIGREQDGSVEVSPALAHSEFRVGDVIGVIGDPEPVAHFIETMALEPQPIEDRHRKEFAREMGLAEVMLAPDSKLVGRTLEGAAFRSRHHVNVLGIRRKGVPLKGGLAGEKLEFGDALLVSGGWKDLGNLRTDKKDFVVLGLPLEMNEVAPARRQARTALIILVAMIVAMTFGLVPNVAAVLIAALALVATRCVTMDGAYKVINWPTLVLIAGMLPLATALQKTGGTTLIVDGLVAALGDFGPETMMAGVFLLTAVLGLFISNTATAVLVAPIAVGIAADLGVSPYPFAMTVAIAASAAFMTPVSSPVNTLVMTPGGYRFGDFVRVGIPLAALVMIVTLLSVLALFPL